MATELSNADFTLFSVSCDGEFVNHVYAKTAELAIYCAHRQIADALIGECEQFDLRGKFDAVALNLQQRLSRQTWLKVFADKSTPALESRLRKAKSDLLKNVLREIIRERNEE